MIPFDPNTSVFLSAHELIEHKYSSRLLTPRPQADPYSVPVGHVVCTKDVADEVIPGQRGCDATMRSMIGGRLRFALATCEVERTDHHVVLYAPVGAPGHDRDGARDGPRGTLLRLDNFADTCSPTVWTGADCLFVHRFGDPWSTWRWVGDERSVRPGAYVNLQEPWTATPIGWDTTDLTLDVVVDGDGAVTFKDEDELDWARPQGVYSSVEVARIREIGRRACEHAEARGWPLDVDWNRWIPAQRELPELPQSLVRV